MNLSVKSSAKVPRSFHFYPSLLAVQQLASLFRSALTNQIIYRLALQLLVFFEFVIVIWFVEVILSRTCHFCFKNRIFLASILMSSLSKRKYAPYSCPLTLIVWNKGSAVFPVNVKTPSFTSAESMIFLSPFSSTYSR